MPYIKKDNNFRFVAKLFEEFIDDNNTAHINGICVPINTYYQLLFGCIQSLAVFQASGSM